MALFSVTFTKVATYVVEAESFDEARDASESSAMFESYFLENAEWEADVEDCRQPNAEATMGVCDGELLEMKEYLEEKSLSKPGAP